MKLLSQKQIQGLTTKRLLAYKNSLLTCHETPTEGDGFFESISKQHPKWTETMTLVKLELSKREHIERKQ